MSCFCGCFGEKDARTVAGASGGQSSDGKTKEDFKKENQDYTDTVRFLATIPLFRRLPKDKDPLIAAAVKAVDFKKGDLVVKQGDVDDTFFMIKSGDADVLVDTDSGQKKVASLKGGDYFGEQTWLTSMPRMATVKANSNMRCYALRKKDFEQLGIDRSVKFVRREAIGYEEHRLEDSDSEEEEVDRGRPPGPKDIAFIVEAIKGNENLTTIVDAADRAVLEKLAESAWRTEVKANEEIVTFGDSKADRFYIVAEGQLDVLVPQDAAVESSMAFRSEAAFWNAHKKVGQVASKKAGTLKAGGSFGELALMYAVPRAATVKSMAPSVLWCIDRKHFKHVLKASSDSDRIIEEYSKFLERIERLAPLLAEERMELAEAIYEMNCRAGDVIFQEGHPSGDIYLLYNGEFTIAKGGGAVVEKVSATPANKRPVFHGEVLRQTKNHTCTITAKSANARVLAIPKAALLALLDTLDTSEVMHKPSHGKKSVTTRRSMVGGRKSRLSVSMTRDSEPLLKADLKALGILGCGGFGTVEFVEHVKTGNTYALKGLSKGYLVQRKMQDSVIYEKDILVMTDSRFIIRLYECYEDAQNLYFLMECGSGGELFDIYLRQSFHGSLPHCRFYAACTMFAFEHLHERRVVYRDLKPENLLLDENGFLKLTDMGLARFCIGKTYTTCGTPVYLAPEVIKCLGHSMGVDWWCLGIMIYELITGVTPFEADRPMKIYAKVMAGVEKVRFPSSMRGAPTDVVKGLLLRNPNERLPMRPGGTENLRKHAFFSEINFDDLFNHKVVPPYKPEVKSKKDFVKSLSGRPGDKAPQAKCPEGQQDWCAGFATV